MRYYHIVANLGVLEPNLRIWKACRLYRRLVVGEAVALGGIKPTKIRDGMGEVYSSEMRAQVAFNDARQRGLHDVFSNSDHDLCRTIHHWAENETHRLAYTRTYKVIDFFFSHTVLAVAALCVGLATLVATIAGVVYAFLQYNCPR
jgi:hypothetical protein